MVHTTPSYGSHFSRLRSTPSNGVRIGIMKGQARASPCEHAPQLLGLRFVPL
nr:MAG TPA: hypothetical protein [Caudoviricetes sp.]